MSVSPAQNFLKPPPVPEVATVTLMPGSTSRKRSAAASLRGATVEEPSIEMEPLSPAWVWPAVVVVEVVDWPPQAARTRAALAVTATMAALFMDRVRTGASPSAGPTRVVVV